MKTVNYIEIPLSEAEDANRGKTVWKDGRCVTLDEGRRHVTVYLGHRMETRHETDSDGAETEREVMTAFAVRADKPLTRDRLINAAEMAAYGLRDASDTASLNAALARKWRENINNLDVEEHDEFIRWVKTEIDRLGLFVKSSSKVDADKPTLSDVMELSRISVRNDTAMTDAQALSVMAFYPDFTELIGKPLAVGEKLRYGGRLYKVIQAHTAQADWLPSELPALYGLITEAHDGTLEDPIPYERMMVLEQGKYYTQYGVTYRCVTGSIVGYDSDLTDLLALLEKVG